MTDISRLYFHFSKVLIFWAINQVKGAKMAENDEKACPHCIWGTAHAMIVIFGTLMQNGNASGLFFIFWKFWFFGPKMEQKGQKWPKMTKKLVHTLSKELQVLWLWFLVHTICKAIISLGFFFFHFSKILNFWATNGVKGQEWSTMTKKLVHTQSKELHLIWLWFLIH